MDLLEDYLRAVARLLPPAKSDDIIAELRDEILTRIEAKESDLGRVLTPDETETLLREFGHPIVVAARYRDGPHHAVGPALYPFWAFAVRLIVIIQAVISAIVFLVQLVGGRDGASALGTAIGSGITGAMMLIGFATVAAWLIERKGIEVGALKNWRVRDLRFFDVTAWGWEGTGREPYRDITQTGPRDGAFGLRSSFAGQGIGSVVGAGVFVLWWTGVIHFGLVRMDLSVLPIDFGGLATIDWPGLKAFVFWSVLAYMAVVIAFGAALVVAAVSGWPGATRLRGAMDVVLGVAVLLMVAWVWFVSPLASVVSVDSAQTLIDKVGAWFHAPFSFSVPTVVTVALVGMAVGEMFRVASGLWEVLTGIARVTHAE